MSACRVACPLGVNAQAYLALTAAKRFDEALAVVREANPLPGICGRVCHHPCEGACTRAQLDEPLGIMYLHRYLADVDRKSDKPWLPEKKEAKNEFAAS